MTESPPPDGLPPCNTGEFSPANIGGSQRKLLAEAVRYCNLSVGGIWLHYFSLGGEAGEYELDAYINASYFLPAQQHDILAQAINELIDMRPPPPRAPLSDNAVSRRIPGQAVNRTIPMKEMKRPERDR